MDMKFKEYIESLDEGDIVNINGSDYTIKEAKQNEVVLEPTWCITDEEKKEETMNMSWGDMIDFII